MDFRKIFEDAVGIALRDELKFINEHREHMVKAFVAETGLKPSECVLIEQRVTVGEGRYEVRVHIRRRTQADEPGPQAAETETPR